MDSEERLAERERELEVQLANSKALLEALKKRLEAVERRVGEMEREAESEGPRSTTPPPTRNHAH
jgi:uncharacterized coiled-coil protein SlyX